MFAVVSSVNWHLFGHVSSHLSDARLRLWRRHSEMNMWRGMCLTRQSFLPWLATADWLPEQMMCSSLMPSLLLQQWSEILQSLWKSTLFFLMTFTFHLPLKDFSDVKCASRVASGRALAAPYADILLLLGSAKSVSVAWRFCPYCIS